ncbi:MAG: hypothetical protein AB7I34_11155 [Rhizobiaceae bacterium]
MQSERASPNPAWVDQIRHFYRDFPERVRRIYERLEKPPSLEMRSCTPQVWKTIGDEIVFCCRLTSLEHLAACIRTFVDALEQYGKYLDSVGKLLDVKGYGWIAAFPSPNVTVPVFSDTKDDEPISDERLTSLPNEALELEADGYPENFDFLGKEIDAGFRSGRHCAADRLSLSLELAWLVTKLNGQGQVKGLAFAYDGRQELKGVLSGRPYPIVSIDVERSQTRRNVREREKVISGNGVSPLPMHIHDFLESFIVDEAIEYPILRDTEADNAVLDLPKSYKDFRINWGAISEEIMQRSKGELEAAIAEPENQSQELDAAITKAADELVARIKNR